MNEKTRIDLAGALPVIGALAAVGTLAAVGIVCASLVKVMSPMEESLANQLHGGPADVTAVDCSPVAAPTAAEQRCTVVYEGLDLKTVVLVHRSSFPTAAFTVEYTPPAPMSMAVGPKELDEQVAVHTSLDLTSVPRDVAAQWIRPMVASAASAAESRLGDQLAQRRKKQSIANSYQ